MFVWWRASLFHHTNVCKISRLWGAISLLVFNKSLSNLAILLISRSSFQWCWWLFCNVSMPKVEKNCEKVYQERLWELIKWPSKEKCFDIYRYKCIEICWGNLYVDISYRGTLCSCCTHLSLFATSSLETKYNSILSITITSLPNYNRVWK